MKGIALSLSLLALIGCGAQRPVIKIQTVEVPTYVLVKVPAKLTQTIAYTPQARACLMAGKPAYCNGQVWQQWQDADAAIDRCNAALSIIAERYGDKP